MSKIAAAQDILAGVRLKGDSWANWSELATALAGFDISLGDSFERLAGGGGWPTASNSRTA
jgi:hypothetical protein